MNEPVTGFGRSRNADLLRIKDAMLRAYAESRDASGKLDTDRYIRKVAPRFALLTPGVPFARRSIRLYEVVETLKQLLSVYGNFTSPILNSLLETNRLSDT